MADFVSFLSASLRVLRDECPTAYEMLSVCLDGVLVAIDVDGERITVTGERGTISQVRGDADIELATHRTVILALIDGHDTLLGSILADRVRLRGRPGELVRTFDALAAYLEGAVRSPSLLDLLDEFRSSHDTT